MQHTHVPYTGTYGQVLMDGLGRLFTLLAGSAWEVTDPARRNVLDSVERAFAPFLHDGLVMDCVNGRAISRGLSTDDRKILRGDHYHGQQLIAALAILAGGADPAERDRWHALIKGWIARDTVSPVLTAPQFGVADLARLRAVADFVFMVRETSQMFITGPDVVKAVTGEEITQNGLGGADVHAETSGVCHFAYDDEETCLAEVRYLLSLLPQNNRENPPRVDSSDPVDRRSDVLLDLVPADGNRPYDMAKVIEEIVDDGEYLEVHERWARNIICALARLDGQVVGIVANQPQTLAGVLDIEASEKAARFVQMCDAFNIPIVTFLDVPGFLPGVDQEHGGIIRHGAKLLYAYCNATVPRISLILRKAYGGAYIVMDSQSIGADLTFAWPTNEIAVMGAEGAANVIFRRQIAGAEDPEAMRQKMVKEYKAELMHPYYAAERGLVDDVIDPAGTREVLIGSLAMLQTKHADLPSRKHGNPPQ
ncbi:Acetyl-coenzyme A carboxylase carboxyl transferase subunit alpha [Streptomyces fumanus]